MQPSQGWDGRFKGRKVEQGVYTVLIEYTILDTVGKPVVETYAGDVTVVR